ncbi:hypothetical protein PTTG_09693 [Puccinia triticina 1-1 BBBD Race 1]|uniref:A-factor receptor n=1 Tax=Puccinia triticina (isolate 1-1 / race 1 (BBBD)) TaxID=630390 RepID=A0A180G6T7_PUCT1|nr:hypothetical protein PTTG_09693 [Puccinia triticina 1-1 BBBD Race 1]
MASGALVNTYLTLSLLCGLFNIPPTVLHISQGHSGPASFGFWAITLNILAFTNGVIWRNDALDRAPVLCDISSKISEVGPLGLLIANCCIIRYLASILTPNRSIEEPQQKRRRILFDYGLSLGFPILTAAGSVVYQVGRYQINNLAGCSSASALVWPTFILSIVWPLVFCGISCCYSLYVLYCLIQRHRDIRKLVNCSGSPLNVSRFARMGVLSVTYFCVATPCAVYGTLETIAATGPYVPWISWSTVHNEDNKLSMVRQYPLYQYQLRDWLPIVAGLMVICFFSCGAESVLMYYKVGIACVARFATAKDKVARCMNLSRKHSRRNHELSGVFSHSFTSSSAEKLHSGKSLKPDLPAHMNSPRALGFDSFQIHVAVVKDTVQAED